MKNSVTTFLQIDLQSLYGPSSRKKLDFERIYVYFNSRETEFLTGACIYSVKSYDFDASKFETKVRTLGYDLKSKNLNTNRRRGETFNISHIVTITIDAIHKLNRFDKLILMTNNTSGFIDLCKFLKDNGKKTELWCFNHNYDPIIEPYVDRHFISDEFCMTENSNIRVFGAHGGPYFEHDAT